jgi:hypothetical protein
MRRPTRQTTFNITTLWGACPPFAIGSQNIVGGNVFLNKVALGACTRGHFLSINWNMQRIFSHKAPAPLHQVRVVHKGCKVAKRHVT